MSVLRAALAAVVVVGLSTDAAAQSAFRSSVEGAVGHAAFLDDEPIDHVMFGAAFRHHLTRRLSVGPEVAWMVGPGRDRDLFVTGNVWIDLLEPSARRRLAPYFVAGGGVMVQYPEFDFLGGPNREGALTAGVGVRVGLGERWYVSPEARLGWEAHSRVTVAFGYRF